MITFKLSKVINKVQSSGLGQHIPTFSHNASILLDSTGSECNSGMQALKQIYDCLNKNIKTEK